MLVLAAACIGPNCVTEEFLGWVNGKPIPIWQCFLLKVVLNDVRILPNDALVTVSASRMSSRRRARWCSYIFWIGKYLRKSRRGFALISRVIEVANANAPSSADAPIPDASSCLPLQWRGSAGSWPSNSVAEIGKTWKSSQEEDKWETTTPWRQL